MFKVGDKVKFKTYPIVGIAHDVPNSFTVKDIPYGGDVLTIKNDQYESHWYASYFELISKPVRKFQIGDRVKCIDVYESYGIRLGNIYTVRDFGTTLAADYTVLLEGFPSNIDLYYESRFELVEPEVKPITVPQEITDYIKKIYEANPIGYQLQYIMQMVNEVYGVKVNINVKVQREVLVEYKSYDA